MAKKKKGIGLGGGNPLMAVFSEMLSGLSPEQQMQLMDSLDVYARSGKSMKEMQEDMYTYQCPDYAKQVKPLAKYLVPLINAAKPSDVIASYEQAHEAMASLSQQEREDALRNFMMCILADGQKGKYGRVKDASALPLFAAFRLVDDFHITGLFDVTLETLKQNPSFYEFYYCGFEDAATLMLAHVGVGHLEEMKEMMKTDGFVSEVYPIVFNAAVQMVVENPACRLQVLAWVSDVLKSCVEVTIPSMAMDWCVKSLAQIKAVELLPLIKTIYKEYQVPPVEIKTRIKGVTQLLTKGTDERIVEIADFEELFDEMLVGENNDFDLLGGNDEDWQNRLLEPDEDEWGDEDDERDADALFYKECGFKPSKPKAAKSGKSKNKKQKYALTLDVSLKGSPRKVYRQLVVPSDLRLDCLGQVLVYAVGWEGYHLNQFMRGNDCYLLPDEDGGLEWGFDSREYTVGNLLNRVGSKIVWEYDFGDSWNHEVKLVEKTEVDGKEEIPVNLLKATGACPPEDCGGVYGYRHLLEVLKNPQNEEYEEMKEWLGEGFDPKKFSLAKARGLIKVYMSGVIPL